MEYLTLFKALQVFGIVVCALASLVTWKERETRGFLPLAVMFAGAVVWGLSMFLARHQSSFLMTKTIFNLLYVGVPFTILGFFVFVLEYTGREQYLTWRNLGLLAIHPVVLQVVVWTNPNGLFYASRQPDPTAATGMSFQYDVLFWVHSAYSYGLLLIGIGLLMRMLYRRQSVYRGQLAAVATIILVPLVANFVSIAGMVPIDITSAGFAFSGAALIVGKYYVDLGNLRPVARSTVVNDIDDGVIVLDEDDQVSDINPAAKDIFNLGESGSVIGKHANNVLSEYPDVWRHFADMDAGDEEIEVETDTGRHSYHVQVSPITDDRGRQSGRVFLIHDITEQKHREEELKRQNEQLDQFASLVSHDLRNPLNVANGYLEAAMGSDDPETMHDFMTEIEQSHDRMEELIEDVLTLAREGQTVENIEPVDLAELSREAWRNVETGAATLQLRTDQHVLADRDRLLRVFENLFRNAMEHGAPSSGSQDQEVANEQDSVALTVRVGEIGEYEPGSLIEAGQRGFFVADDGPGIPEDHREKVLEDGFSTAEDGTGLGLSIASSIVRAHGWEISVTESDDGGARFDVTGVSLAAGSEQAKDGGDGRASA